MRALAVTSFGVDYLESVTLPQPVAGRGQVVVQNHAAGVNNVDLLIRRGGVPVPLPHILGVEGAGVIVEVGEGVSELTVGNHVLWLGSLGSGGYGPFTVVEASYVAKLDKSVPFELAAAAPVAYATARNALFSYGVPSPGSWILVHSAAGGVGVASLQVARNAGFRTIALTTPSKLSFVLEQGANIAIDRGSDDVIGQILAATGDEGVALSLNSVAGPTILQDLQVLGDLGQIVSFGHLGGVPSGTAADLMMPHFNKSIGIRISDLYTLWRVNKRAFSAILRQTAHDLATNEIAPQIYAIVPTGQIVDAHAQLASGETKGKIVLRNT